MEEIKRKFTDSNGTSEISVIGDEAPLGGDFVNNTYVIANHATKGKKFPNAMTQNIGPRSNGFAGVFTLATIIAIAGVVIAYLTLRY